jgi:ABC-type branched-subunit amino acid transport system ATPase component
MSPSMLEVTAISKHFGGVAAASEVSFSVAAGSITALIGPNGAGKTTVFNLISGFLRLDGGTIRFAGRRIDRWRGDAVARAGLVRVFQAPRVPTRMTVLDNMLLAAKHQPGERIVLSLFTPRRVARREREIRQQALGILELLRLQHLAGAYAGTLSGGQRKLLELGRALMVEPRMILLDEPMAGVAPILAQQLLDYIQQLRDQRGVTVLVIEHDMEVVMSISERVIVMDEGRVIADASPEAVQNDERVIEAYLGRLAPGEGPEPARATP